jgi:hypothetical protein
LDAGEDRLDQGSIDRSGVPVHELADLPLGIHCDIAVVVALMCRMKHKRCLSSAALMILNHFRQVNIEKDITMNNQSRLISEKLPQASHPTGRAQQLVLFRVSDVDSQTFSAAEPLTNARTLVMQVYGDVVDTSLFDLPDEISQQRVIEDWHEWLW